MIAPPVKPQGPTTGHLIKSTLVVPSPTHLIKGTLAEAMAKDYLLQQGLILLEERFKTNIGEIDLVMKDQQEEVVFVEVRSRGDDPLVHPLDTVTRPKQRRIILTAQCYLQKHPRLAKNVCRFDVVGILGNFLNPEITWIMDAFSVK